MSSGASVAELEKRVNELQKLLQEEITKTNTVENEVKELKELVQKLKGGNTTTTTTATQQSTAKQDSKTNGAPKHTTIQSAKKESSSEEEESSSSEESSSESEDEEKGTKAKKSATKDASNSNTMVMEGFLEKKGAMRKNWQRRYFVLNSKDKTLNYYEKKVDPKETKEPPKGVIPLINATCYAHVEKKGQVKPLFFNIRTETRDYLLRAEKQEEKTAWVKAIKANCTKGTVPPEQRKHLISKPSSFIGRTTEDTSKKK